ncbi:alpha-1 2-mannosidase [Parapedobacter defluvii]|uniref:Alpha-1 2-mannosidase n=2 Tax=Parapedobacter defluvii TaxID=2045106 RepID=A0ABQ1KZW6_9SPHI|nr:alpha-1 2-mannosidase [Parapedobacter defluvii]
MGCSQKTDVLDCVDPFIGTDAHGHTFPGATTPFGMVQLSPSNDAKGWGWCSGYHYSDSVLKGFAHTHLSGTGLAGLGDILLMPTMDPVQTDAGTEKNPESGYRSRFSHDEEGASPGYYWVHLLDDDIRVELTCTPRVGFHRYTFNRAGKGNIIVDPTHHIYETVEKTEIEMISDTEIRGYKQSDGAGGNRKVYFYAKFSKPFTAYGIAVGDSMIHEKGTKTGHSIKAYGSFNVQRGESIEVKVALSFIGYEGAKKNFEAEAADKNFDEVREGAADKWREKLSKIEVKGGTRKDKRIFYTGLYHAMIAPNLINDVDGNYCIEGKVYTDTANQYSTFSTWDTFRALHPLLTIIDPQITKEIVNSLISRHFDSKVELPIWELCGYDNACMTSYTPTSVIVDAVRKGIPGIDPERAYQAVKAASLYDPKASYYAGGQILPWLKKYNYVPSHLVQSVTHTMEYAYQDWCIYVLAKELNKIEDTAYYKKRSQSYLNLYRPEKGYFWPKDTLGNWTDVNLTDWHNMQAHYITGNIWGYSTFIPHGMDKLIELKGGKEKFCAWIDAIISDTTHIEGDVHVDLSGFIGKYGHGDEPSHQMPYLYNYGGQPWKTQALVRRVMDTFYADTPDGLVNNEDCGQMSAWYIFGALGFYPFCPADNLYTLGSPLFEEVIIHLGGGKTFTIAAKNASGNNKYVQQAHIDGFPLEQPFIRHEDIQRGGRLEFIMGAHPAESAFIQLN